MKGTVIFVLSTLLGAGFITASPTISVPKDVQFLNVPAGKLQDPFRIQNGEIEQLKGEHWVPFSIDDGNLRVGAITQEGKYVLGAPAITSKVTTLNVSSINGGILPVKAAYLGASIWMVVEHREKDAGGGDVITSFAMYKVQNDATESFLKVSTFSLENNVYNFSVSELFPLSDNFLAIVLRSSRNALENEMIFYDIQQKRVVGVREFSLFQWLPSEKSFWFVDPIPNTDNIAEILKSYKDHAQIIPVDLEHKINPVFTDLTGIKQ